MRADKPLAMADLKVQLAALPQHEDAMTAKRLPLLFALLLAPAWEASFALAESPLPDPIAPAVIGRPLDQIRPARPNSAGKVVRKKAAAPKVARPAAPQPGTAILGAAPAAALPALTFPGMDPQPAPGQRQAKRALDDRADPRMRADDVGQGTHFARKPLGPGAYFADKDRAAVAKYFQAHPPAGAAPKWQIGQALPRGLKVAAVPPAVQGSLPQVPPGHRYVQLGGDILLVASGSGMVVDGISARAAR
jgi:hypothetical protein